jgi:hypothetical protein
VTETEVTRTRTASRASVRVPPSATSAGVTSIGSGVGEVSAEGVIVGLAIWICPLKGWTVPSTSMVSPAVTVGTPPV